MIGLYLSIPKRYFVNPLREPSSIRKNYDFAELTDHLTENKLKEELLGASEFIKYPHGYKIKFGQFQFVTKDGSNAETCDHYSKVILKFVGDGFASSGDAPEILFEGQCVGSENGNRSTHYIQIAVDDIVKLSPGDGDYSLEQGAKLNFTNLGEQWPQVWSLDSIEFVDPQGEYQSIKMSQQDINRRFNGPVVMDWKAWLPYKTF